MDRLHDLERDATGDGVDEDVPAGARSGGRDGAATPAGIASCVRETSRRRRSAQGRPLHSSPVHAGCVADLERGLRVLARGVADGNRDVLPVEPRNLRAAARMLAWGTTAITRMSACARARTLTNVDSIVGLYVSTKWSSTYRITVADLPARATHRVGGGGTPLGGGACPAAPFAPTPRAPRTTSCRLFLGPRCEFTIDTSVVAAAAESIQAPRALCPRNEMTGTGEFW